MSETTNEFGGTMAGLPDPERDRQFYEGVPARRLVAFFIDTVVIVAISLVAIRSSASSPSASVSS